MFGSIIFILASESMGPSLIPRFHLPSDEFTMPV